MKLAVLIAGEYREFEVAVKSWSFLKLTPDVYFSTWNVTSETNPKLNINISETVDEERIKAQIPECKTIIEPPIEHFYPNQKMIYKWLSAINMMVQSGKTYDAVILLRPDLFLDCDVDSLVNFIKNIDSEKIYGHTHNAPINNHMPDLIVMGSQTAITKLLTLPVDELAVAEHVNIHWWLAVHLNRLYKSIDNMSFLKGKGLTVVRSNARDLAVKTVEGINKRANKWYSTKHNNETIVKEFSGFSGSKVFLIKNLFPIESTNTHYMIKKQGNVERNYEKMIMLRDAGFNVPQIYFKSHDILDMEFISGYDISAFLERFSVDLLLNFISNTIDQFKKTSIQKDYSLTYKKHLESLIGDKNLPFEIEEFINCLPKVFSSSLCHGDFTLENLIFKDEKFFMIDPSTGVYDSWIFDLAKLRQDLDGKWFLRKTKNKNRFDVELAYLKSALNLKYPEAFDDNLYILMLLRVYKYVKPEQPEYTLILEEIKRLWK